jgi:hypothetical protein
MIRMIQMTLVALCLSGVAAYAQPSTEATPEVPATMPCSKDIETYCAGITPGGGALAKCLHDNKAKLSSECKASRDKMKQAFKEVKEACHDDYEKLCADIKPGKGRIMKCMKEHKDELSMQCKEEIEKKKAAHKKKHG